VPRVPSHYGRRSRAEAGTPRRNHCDDRELSAEPPGRPIRGARDPGGRRLRPGRIAKKVVDQVRRDSSHLLHTPLPEAERVAIGVKKRARRVPSAAEDRSAGFVGDRPGARVFSGPSGEERFRATSRNDDDGVLREGAAGIQRGRGRPETGARPLGESMSQDLLGPQSSEVVEEARNPREVGTSAEETPLPTDSDTPQVRKTGAPVSQGHGRRTATERWPGPAPKGVGSRRRGRSRAFAPEGRRHLARGPRGPLSSLAGVRALAALAPLGGWAGRGSELWVEKTSEGQKSRRASAGGSGETRVGVNGLAERNKASKRVKSSQRGDHTSGRPGGPGGALRREERDLIVVGGGRLPRSFGRARLSKPAVTRRSRVRFSTAADDRKGASGLERGARLCARGKL